MAFFKSVPVLPKQLHICLLGRRIQIQSRATDHGFLWPIARGLAKLGHQVSVISGRSPLGKNFIERDGVKAYYLQEDSSPLRNKNFNEAAYEKFLQIHKESKVHLIHSLDESALLIGQNRKNLGVALAYDIEATQMSQIFSILGMSQESLRSLLVTGAAVVYKYLSTYLGRDRRILKTADGIFVTNPEQRIYLERYYLYPDYHIYTVPYGVDIGDLSPKEGSLEIRKKLGLSEHSHVAVTISDMSDIREILPLLQAFEKVAVKLPYSYLILLGNGPYYKQIEYEILNMALGNRVIMPGAVASSDILDYILLSSVFINLSSRTTGIEPTMVEAMAQKKLIIGSEVSPIANVVEEGVDGYLVRPADTESLSALLIDIFTNQIPLTEIGERARKKVIDLFDPQKMIGAVSDAYAKILIRQGYFRPNPTNSNTLPPRPRPDANL